MTLTSFYPSFWTKFTLLSLPLSSAFNHYCVEESSGVLSRTSRCVLATLLRIPKFGSIRTRLVSELYGESGTEYLLETNNSQTSS